MLKNKVHTTKIIATSRASVKIKDNFYTIEYSEERSVDEDLNPEYLEKERQFLFDDVNAIVDAQIEDIVNSFRK